MICLLLRFGNAMVHVASLASLQHAVLHEYAILHEKLAPVFVGEAVFLCGEVVCITEVNHRKCE